MRWGVVVALTVASLGGCAARPVADATPRPLAERIWDVHAARFVDAAEVEARVAAADYALLGETHDNPRHHEIQLQLLRHAAADAKRAIAFEQVDLENEPAMLAAREASDATAASVMAAARVAPAWPAKLYEPLFAFALEHGLPIVAANYSRQRARDVVSRGLEAIPEPEARRLALAEAWSPARNAKQRAILVDGHCGQDDPIIDKLVDVQRVRDAVMADAILRHPRTVAIIGRGHARADLGVPLYLAQRAPGRRVLSLGLVEVEDGKARPAEYGDAQPGVHDLVWFTARAPRADPCASFKPIHR